jgi:DNA-binding CsgD family transcriptional regulator
MRAAMLISSLILFATVFALALVVEEPEAGILHLHAVPIAILALSLGIVAGLSAVAFSLSLMAVWAELEGVELLVLDYMTGAIPFLLVVFLCQIAMGRSGRPGQTTKRARQQPPKELSEREKEVLALLAMGYTNKEVAERLYLSVRTVESHRARIQRKLLVSSRAELVRHALERDLVDWRSAVP